MNNAAVHRFNSTSLKYKILFGFLCSILPMLIIVVVTYIPAKQSALESSHNQIRLISGNGEEKLNGILKSALTSFKEWTQEDVFGMAIEFDALDELKGHFSSLQTQNPEFRLILITDVNGIVLEQSYSSRSQERKSVSLKGGTIKEMKRIVSGADFSIFLVENSFVGQAELQPATFLLYGFRTSDSSGETNGYLLAYMELESLQDKTDTILSEMRRSGFATSRVVVLDTTTEKVISYSGKPLEDTKRPLGPPVQQVLRETAAGKISIFNTPQGIEHVVFVPLHVIPPVAGMVVGVQAGPTLSLFISVAEREIMTKVQKILMAAIIIGGIGVLAIIFIGLFTVRLITGPIASLVDVLQQYSGGDSNVRAEVKSRDEIGYFTEEFNTMLEQINSTGAALHESEARYRTMFESLQKAINSKDYGFRLTPGSKDDELTLSLNMMLETLETADSRVREEDWLKTGLTRLNVKVSGEHKLEDLCKYAITFIAGYMGAQVGTIFAINRDEVDSYDLIASYAFRKRKGGTNRYKKGEGLVGQAALEKKVIHFTEIPDDYMWIESSLGSSRPMNILVVPLVYEGNVMGVVELAASFKFSQRYIDFSEQVSRVVAVAINAAIANERLKGLLEKTRSQSQALRSQQRELQKANEELEGQTEILKESEARLQVQQEELQASNEEMEEKNEMLEEQKKENEAKNRNLIEKQHEIEEKAKQLQLATKYKSEFLSNMSHELRTPLNSMLLLAKMLSENDEKNLNDDQVESADSIHRSGMNLLHLINDILDLSKIEAGRVELSLSTIEPKSVISDFELEFNHIAKDKGLEFVTELGEGLPKTITTDVHRLAQVVRNLLGNAFKFTASGSVNLCIARPSASSIIKREDLDPETTVAISVTDSGSGIPKDKLGIIFESFKQVDGSITRQYGGTGLGLSISRELAALIGGELTASSTLGEGTEFTLFVPEYFSPELALEGVDVKMVSPNKEENTVLLREFSDGIAADDLKRQVLPVTGLNSPARTMLIIEDDQVFSTILTDFFKKNGYESIVATSGETGVKYAIEHKPTSVILDIGLPGIDGWTVLNELKNNPDTRHIPVHIMSAYDKTSEGLKKGAVGYLTKPVSIGGLKSALGKIECVLENEVKELLVVEDDKELRDNILKLMTTRDIHATAAGTGAKAMELLKKNRFDCMILDLGLPDVSGFTLLDEIEKDESIARVPVIIYTGRDLSREEADRLEKYSTSIVLKSAFSMERLLDETALFMHRVEQEMPESHQKMIQKVRDRDSNIKGKNVLVVDDDMRNAFALSKFLKSRGLEVTIANDGKKALEILEEEPRPDIVLMDIMMPVMDGYETMQEIRKIKKFKDLPILALTAKAMETDREECIRCGASDYLTKPINTSKLLSMLRIWMY